MSASGMLTFQQLDTDYYSAFPGSSFFELCKKLGRTNRRQLEGKVPIIRLYGRTCDGASVVAHVHCYEPYFYVRAPPDFNQGMLQQFAKTLDSLVRERINGDEEALFVQYAELCDRQTIWNYQGSGKDRFCSFIRVVVSLPQHIAPARAILELGVSIPALGTRFTFLTYEANVSFVMRYMVDAGIVGASWVSIKEQYSLARAQNAKETSCDIEIDVVWDSVTAHKPEKEWLGVAPLRILSFDIECAGRRGVFPVPEEDPVIQIASVVSVHSQQSVEKIVFTLNSCSAISGAEVRSFERESELLSAWRDFVVEKVDPDILTGYNIVGFDIPYLVRRAEVVGSSSFAFLGRIVRSKAKVRKTTFSSVQAGNRETYEITIEGRVIFDVIQAIRASYKLHSYSLNSVSAQFLGEQKEDVHHSIISDLQNGDADTRRRLAVYCIKDAHLPLRLIERLMLLYNYMEMARVTGVPVGWLLVRGQMLKVMSQLLRKTRERGLVLPCVAFDSTDDKFAGATVIEPKKGFYTEPVATLDFASLYPSIMMAHNLCYSTLVPAHEVCKMQEQDITRTPTGDCFVKASVKKGILPEILEELLQARKRAKADLREAKDPMHKAVLDGRQLALKISANSVYGFTGAQVGKLPCLEISSSVTAFGREMIELTKLKIESKYTVANGYASDASVIYGDTDSVMIRFGTTTSSREEEEGGGGAVGAAMEMAVQAAEYVNTFFVRPIKLEFEKVYYPYLLMNKKRYAALLWTNPSTFDKMDCKGIETVRRDNCGLVRNVISTCLDIILKERDTSKAAEYVKSCVRDLLTNKIDISELVITKALHKTAEKSKVPQAHVALAEKMRLRDPSSAPVLGDRVAYVMIRGAKKSKAYENAEDPLYVLEHNLCIDAHHYLEHHLSKPVTRLFAAILPNPESLLKGEHTRQISIPTPTLTGAMSAFVKKVPSCLGCGVPMQAQSGQATCIHCRKDESRVYLRIAQEAAASQASFSKFWTQCQRCQGSLHQKVICSARDCPIFYRRSKAYSDMVKTQTALERFV